MVHLLSAYPAVHSAGVRNRTNQVSAQCLSPVQGSEASSVCFVKQNTFSSKNVSLNPKMQNRRGEEKAQSHLLAAAGRWSPGGNSLTLNPTS